MPNPESFGRFTLIDRLAVGGMAEIYLARASGAEGLHKFFALKRILPQHMKDLEFVQMFKSEAMIAINLTQSNIAQIYEFGQENGQFYLALEFIEGRDLRQILTRCAEVKDGFTIEQSIFLISEVASGLDFAHRCIDKKSGRPLKIIHRDMSPQNIMINLDGEVKIIDFGIAKAESRLGTTRAGTVKGKISYMSPEQALAQELDGRTDIFSAGIILWELLTGRRLFEVEEEEMATVNKIRECRIQDIRIYNPKVPEEVHRIAMRALTKDRNYRYATARDFHRDLLSCLHKLNPNFAREDLSVLMKRLFQAEIENYRRQIQQSFDSADTIEVTSSQEIALPVSSAEAPVGLIVNTAPAPATGDHPQWNAADLLNSSEVKAHAIRQKLVDEEQVAAKKQLVQMAAQNQKNQDLLIMGFATLAFAVVAAGIYFRAGLAHVVENQKGNISAMISKVQGNDGSRTTASVQLHEGGGDGNSSSKNADLKNTKIKVRAFPAQAMVELNGQPYGKVPAELLLPINTHVTVTVKHEGYSTFKQDFTVTGPKEINVTLEKIK